MANLPPVPVMGSEGPPPMKKPRTDSDSGKTSKLGGRGGLAECTFLGTIIIDSCVYN